MSDIELVKSAELKKHVGLIHSTNYLSLVERKIANALLFNAYHDLKDKSEHQINIGDLCKLIGYKSNEQNLIKKSLISLISTVLEWNILDKAKKDSVWVASSMLSDAKIEGSICTYSYSNRMRELCYYPEFYARLNLKTVSAFKSTYGIALYENCVRYRNIKHTPWMEIDLYRKLMGVPVGKYEKFKDLNTRVVKKSVEEVNKHSVIKVKPEFKKMGRSITKIRFLINDEQPESIVKEDATLTTLVEGFGFTPHQATSVLKDKGQEFIKSKISIVENSVPFRTGKIKNLYQYLLAAIEKDFQAPKGSSERVRAVNDNAEKKNREKQVIAELKDNYTKYLSANISSIMKVSDPYQRNSILDGFEAFIKPTVYYSLFKKGGLEDALIKDRFISYLKKEYKYVLEAFCSFEEFKNQSELVAE